MFFLVIMESVILASSCSLDAFSASFAYGSKKIRIPFWSNQIINIVCAAILGVSLFAGAFVRQFLPGRLTVWTAFVILFTIGFLKLLDGIIKSLIRHYTHKNNAPLKKEIKFSFFSLKFILKLYADPEDVDLNADKIISPAEAALLAFSLSLDGLAAGFGAAVGNINIPAVLAASLVANMTMLYLGSFLGDKLARKLPFNISWLGGAVLIGLAVIKLL